MMFRYALISAVCFSIFGTAAGQVVTNKQPVQAPVVLFLDSDGSAYTYQFESGTQSVLARAATRKVSVEEILALEDAGFPIAFRSADGRMVNKDSGGFDSNISPDAVPPQMSSLPANFSIVQLSGVVYGNFYVAGTRPTGTNTQWVAFTYTSSRMLGFGSHIAISLLADTAQLLNNYPPTYAPAVVGNGVIVGNVSGTLNGCHYAGNSTPAYNMEVESYWNGGNKLYQNTCAPSGLSDGPAYNTQIQANIMGNVAYGVTGGTVWNSPSPYTIPDRPTGSAGSLSGGGLIFAMVTAPSDPDYVVANFNNAGTGWF